MKRLRSILNVFVTSIVIVFAVGACAPTSSSSTSGVTPADSSASSPSSVEPTLCSWFIKTQALRRVRIQASNEFVAAFEKFPDDASSVTESTYRDLKTTIEKFSSANTDFVAAWTKLGSHPDAKEFWGNELQSTQMKIEALALMAEAVKADTIDVTKYSGGATKFEEAGTIGAKGEAAMQKIYASCK